MANKLSIIESSPDPKYNGRIPPEGVRPFIDRKLPINHDPSGKIFFRKYPGLGITVQGRTEGEDIVISIEKPGEKPGITVKETIYIATGTKEAVVDVPEVRTSYKINN
jgi:hypothetical protein